MKILTTPKNARLYFHFYQDDADLDGYAPAIIEENIEKLIERDVRAVFIISSDKVDFDSYMDLVDRYRNRGLEVKSIYLESLNTDHLSSVKTAVKDICIQLKKGNCQLFFYGKGFGGTLVASLLVFANHTPEEAIRRIRKINDSFINSDEEISFVSEFYDYIKSSRQNISSESYSNKESSAIPEPELSDKNKLVEKTDGDVSTEDNISLHDEEKNESKKETPKPDINNRLDKKEYKKNKKEYKKIRTKPVDIKLGHFYSTVRFKLISIISLIIIISLSGIIFLATFFFKSYNEMRVRENNHKISEVVALNVKSNLLSIIGNSRLIATTLIQLKTRREKKRYSDIFFKNNRDYIFLGIFVKAGKGRMALNDSIVNAQFLNENPVTSDDIKLVNRGNSDLFKESFNGGVVVHNISQGFKIPVIGMSFPFVTDGGQRVKSILVAYLKIDNLLAAFKTSASDITETFMVNVRGDMIAHPDGNIVLSGGNYINLPIVEMMMQSKIDNGQKKYRDENGVSHLGSFKKLGLGGIGVIATVKEERAFAEVYNIQRRNIYLMGAVLSIAILIVYFFGRGLTRPILNLLGATKRIETGEYEVDIVPTTRDEIGQLTSSFIEMGKGLKEREKIKDAFGRFVSKDIADMATKGELRLGGERKTVAVMFSDIRSFTSISERMEPEEVVDFLNKYMTRMVECIEKNNGIVDKFIGDAIMALWGTPISKGNDTESAINTALMMRKELIDFNKERGSDKKPVIRTGCGINTGAVLAGQIGSENRMEYTVIGDTVNLASRIEDLNKAFGTDILIAEDTYNMVRDIFVVEKMDKIRVKGKSEPQQVYAILGRTDDPESIRSVEELRKLLGIEKQQFQRKIEDLDKKEVKYEVLQ